MNVGRNRSVQADPLDRPSRGARTWQAASLLGLVVLCLAEQRAPAAYTNITSCADTTLSENYPSNNLGGVAFANSGTTQNFTRKRALFKFDIAGALPRGALVQTASLTLEVIKQPSAGYAFADFDLHRMLQDWGEGTEVSPTNGISPGSGSLAVAGEATWYYRFALTNSWSAPGAAAGTDYVTTVSASQTIYGVGDSTYTFGPGAAMAADVQSWLDHPQANFGWILVSEAEDTDFTARRFASRENTNSNPPQLVIQYLIPPRIDLTQKSGNEFSLGFLAQPGQTYQIQFQDVLGSGVWQPLATLPKQSDPVRVLVVDTIGPARRFYRVSTY